MQEKFKDFQILHGREEKVNPKLTAYQVELVQVEAEIEKLCSMLNSSMFTHTQAITPRKDSKSKVIVYLERKCLFGEETYRHICYTEMRLAGANTKANRRTK